MLHPVSLGELGWNGCTFQLGGMTTFSGGSVTVPVNMETLEEQQQQQQQHDNNDNNDNNL